MANLIIFLLLFLSRLLFLSPLPIYFDSPEYANLISNPNLFHALTKGHEPIHPGFILPSWFIYRALPISSLYAAEIVSSLFAALGLFTFYKIVLIYFSKTIAVRSLIITSLLPMLFLAGVNALTDTTYIFFYLFAFYSLSRYLLNQSKNISGRKWFLIGILSLAYSIFTHTQVIIWLPLFFTPLIFSKLQLKSIKSSTLNQGPTLHQGRTLIVKIVCMFLGSGIVLGVGSLVFLLILSGESVFSSLKLLFMHGGDFITSSNPILAALRSIRNLGITLLRSNSTLIILYALFGLILLYRKNKKQALLLIIWFIPVILSSQYWHIGLFGRTSLLASFPLAILAVHIKSRILLAILFIQLAVITIPLAFSNLSGGVQVKLTSLYKSVPENAVLISSNLIRPQVSFYGEKYYINEPGQDIEFIKEKIDSALVMGRPVYIDSQALYNPYYSYDGNHLHILSLGSYGKSEVSSLFKEYEIGIVMMGESERIYLYQVNPLRKDVKGTVRKAKPGQEVFVYSKKPQEKINPMRIDYLDAGTWIWTLVANRTEPIVWTIADKNGEYELPGY